MWLGDPVRLRPGSIIKQEMHFNIDSRDGSTLVVVSGFLISVDDNPLLVLFAGTPPQPVGESSRDMTGGEGLSRKMLAPNPLEASSCLALASRARALRSPGLRSCLLLYKEDLWMTANHCSIKVMLVKQQSSYTLFW